MAHQQLGYYSLGTNPSNGQVINVIVNGTTIALTAVSAIGSAAGNFLIAGTAAATLQNALNLLQNPWTTNPTQVALTLANQELLAYVGFALSGTTLTAYSLNTTLQAPLTSYNGTTTFTSGSWTAQTMQLYVEPGVFYINGTQVKFLGGSTPTVTAPVSHPRIDLLTINSSGSLAWTTGTESASPVPPTYPVFTFVPICELYNVVGETALYDLMNQQSGQGYIQADVRAFPAITTNFSAISQDFLPDTTTTRSLGSPSKEFLAIYSQSIYSNGAAVAFSKFAGTGADGALTVTSGMTTIDLGSAAIFVKNYTSISITGTGAVNFSNPNARGTLIIFLCQGNVTITSSASPALDISNLGSAGGASTGGSNSFGDWLGGNIAGAGASPGGGNPGAGGGAGGSNTDSTGSNGVNEGGVAGGIPGARHGWIVALAQWMRFGIVPATGGAGGANSFADSAGGAGGAGAGAFWCECGGALNLTSTMNANATNGSNATGFNNGGGGGGGGGHFVFLYLTLTANTATFNNVAGDGGSGSGGGGAGGAGATGSNLVAKNINFV